MNKIIGQNIYIFIKELSSQVVTDSAEVENGDLFITKVTHSVIIVGDKNKISPSFTSE